MKILAAVTFVSSLAGCASYGGSGLPPGSPEAQVRASMGAPALEFSNADGSRRLVYPRGPLGTQTFMADIDRNGKLESVTPVLSDDSFYHVRPGMTRDEVLRTIGPPGETMHFARTNQDSWDYRYQDTWGYVAIFSVNLDATTGTVVSTFKRRIERDRGR
jgi:outer membrane protein assembly factor BamE (lipoprotein component of BamABCDE complex)